MSKPGLTRRSRRLARTYQLELGGLDKRQQRRLIRRLVPKYTSTPWSNPKHDVLADMAAFIRRERERPSYFEERHPDLLVYIGPARAR